MEESTVKRVLGIANYEARWVARSFLVRLTATGILPCANYSAQLEQRPEKVLPPMWDMVFYTEPHCLKALRPFSIEVFVHNPGITDHISVRDATGDHDIPILPAMENSDLVELEEMFADEQYCVHARLPAPESKHQGCLVVPVGTILPAIYYRAFGPATKEECDAFALQNCMAAAPLELPTGGEIPWPVLANE